MFQRVAWLVRYGYAFMGFLLGGVAIGYGGVGALLCVGGLLTTSNYAHDGAPLWLALAYAISVLVCGLSTWSEASTYERPVFKIWQQ